MQYAFTLIAGVKGTLWYIVQGIYYSAYTDNIDKRPVVILLMPTKRNKKRTFIPRCSQLIN